LLLLLVSSATAQESQPQEPTPQQPTKILSIYDWKDLDIQKKLPGSEIISIDGIPTWKIQITNFAPLEVSLLTITNASILKKTYSTHFSFEMKYENAKLNGWDRPDYLELSCMFPPLAIGGDQRTNTSNYQIDGYSSISLSSNWRPHDLKVNWMPGSLPAELELKLYLAGSGTFYFRPIKLVGTKENSNWWTPQQAGMIGGAVGIFGGVIGCFGGLLGCLAGFGKARKFVLTTTKIFIALGMLLTITGIVAIVCKQPFFVWYVFLLPGVVLTLIFSLNFPMIQRRYDDLEIRRMASIDAMGS
jgi:hypothetical protein